MADTIEKNLTDAAVAVAKSEAAALKSAEAAFASASDAVVAPLKAVAATAPKPAKRAPAKRAAKAKPARKAVERKPATRAAAVRKPATRKAAARKATQPTRVAAVKRNTVNLKAPVRTAARTIEQGATIMNQQTRKTVDNGFVAEHVAELVGDVNERAKAATERSAKIVEEMADLTRGNVEAIVASSKLAAKGVETLSQDAADYGRKSFEQASKTLKSFAEVKSPTDFFRLQGDYTRSAFDAAIAQSARVSEAMMKIAGDAAEPINSRYTVAAERVKTLAA